MAQETRRVEFLKPHPWNPETYRDGPGEQFTDDVRKAGIRFPLIIKPDDTIVSGHRRLAAAIAVGLKEVPVIVREYADESAELEDFIGSNNHRKKTHEQLGREGQRVRDDEGRVRGEGRWQDRAARLSGEPADKVYRCTIVVDQIDELRALGDHVGAESLRLTLEESVRRAYDSLRREPPIQVPLPSDADCPGPDLVGPQEFDLAEAAADEPDEAPEVPDDPGPAPIPPQPEKKPRKEKKRELSPYDQGTADIEAAREAAPKECPQGCPLETDEEQDVFDILPEFDSLEKMLREAHTLMKALAVDVGGEGLQVKMQLRKAKSAEELKWHSIELENALRAVKGARPACRYCPYCAYADCPDNSKKCRRCRGLLYCTAEVWEGAEEEMREAAKKQGKK